MHLPLSLVVYLQMFSQVCTFL